MSIIEALDRPIAFHRCFVPLVGGVGAAVMLSQAVYWQQRVPEGRTGWWWKTAVEWEEETGLSRREQETARKKLRKTQFWEEKTEGLPRRLWFRLDVSELEKSLENSVSQIRHTGCTNPPSKHGGKCHPISETTTETTSKTTPAASGGKNRGVHAARERLSFASEFGFAWTRSHQALLDESRACAIIKRFGIDDACKARHIIAEWSAEAARGFTRDDPAAALVWLYRRSAHPTEPPLATSRGGESSMPSWI